MEQSQRLTAIIEHEDGVYVSRCPELDIASQGTSVEQARANLIEALTLFLGVAAEDEIARRMPNFEAAQQTERRQFLALAKRFRAATD